MVESQLDSLLKMFEPYFKCSLTADDNQSCLIKLAIGIQIQIELNRYGSLLIGCQLGQSIGRYQDLLFKEALKANYLHPLSTGILGFSRKTNQLILFITVDPLALKSHEISKILDPFLANAALWSTAIKNNALPVLVGDKLESAKDKLFGL